MSNNPFTQRGMIQSPSDFIGREDEVRHIFSRIETLQSCSIVGERRIGKSSLLYHIVQTGNERLENDLLRFVYVDLSEAYAQTQVDLLQTLLSKLELNPNVISEAAKIHKNLMAFSSELEKLEQEGGLAVLCLDGFEGLFHYKSEFNDGFFNHLRSLMNRRTLIIIPATRQALEIYALAEKLTSPFFNLFSIVELGLFKEKERARFIEYYAAQVNFTAQELVLIKTYAEPHPLKLHIFCDQLMEARHHGWSQHQALVEYDKHCKAFIGGEHKVTQATNTFKRLVSGETMGRWLDNVRKFRDLFKGNE